MVYFPQYLGGLLSIHGRDKKGKKETKPDIENVVLDGGFASKEEALDKGVNIGDIVTFDQDIRTLNNQFWVGRGLDNRIGGYGHCPSSPQNP